MYWKPIKCNIIDIKMKGGECKFLKCIINICIIIIFFLFKDMNQSLFFKGSNSQKIEVFTSSEVELSGKITRFT